MTQEKLNIGKELEERMAICDQIIRVMKSNNAFPEARFAMIKDNSMNYIVDLPTEIKDGIVALVKGQLKKLQKEFDEL